MEDLVLLYSGGADSTLLLKMAQSMERKVFAVMIDYGQLHIKELEFANEYLKKHSIPNMTIKIDGYNVNSALTGSGEKGIYEGVHEMNVPARNSIFLSLAAGVAESKGITEIWFGANWEDYEHLFPDCYQSFVGKINEVFAISGVRPIKVYAPLLGMQKYMIKKLMNVYEIRDEDIYSGYGEFT